MGYVIRSSDTTAINGIRQLVSVNLTPGVLSDSVIDSPAFERAAEFHVYRLLNFIADDDSNVDADSKYAQRVGLPVDLPRFPRNQFPDTFSYKGQYSTTSYQQNDIVYDGTNLYYANKVITSAPATRDTVDWTQINISFKGQYSSGTPYLVNDIVYDGSNLYYANKVITSAPATRVTADWIQISSISQTPAQRQSEERIKIAVQYQTAIRLILSMPQLLEEQILRERVRFQEINWEKRVEFYESETTDTLEPEVPEGTIFSDGVSIFGEVKQYVAF